MLASKCYVVENGLGLLILLSVPPKHWGYFISVIIRHHTQGYVISVVIRHQTQGYIISVVISQQNQGKIINVGKWQHIQVT